MPLSEQFYIFFAIKNSDIFEMFLIAGTAYKIMATGTVIIGTGIGICSCVIMSLTQLVNKAKYYIVLHIRVQKP